MEHETSNNVFYEFEKFVVDEFNLSIRQQLLVEVREHCETNEINYSEYFEFLNIPLNEFEASIIKGVVKKSYLLLILITLNLSIKRSMTYLTSFGHTLSSENKYERKIIQIISDNYKQVKFKKLLHR